MGFTAYFFSSEIGNLFFLQILNLISILKFITGKEAFVRIVWYDIIYGIGRDSITENCNKKIKIIYTSYTVFSENSDSHSFKNSLKTDFCQYSVETES